MSQENVLSNLIIEQGAFLPPYNTENKTFVRGIFTTIDKVNEIRTTYNNTAIHQSVWMYSEQDQDKADLYGDYYMDFDSQNFEEVRTDALKVIGLMKVLFGIKDENFKLYFSGSKGVHIIIPATIFGIKPDPMLHETYKFIARDISTYLKDRTKIDSNGKPKVYKTLDTQPYHKKAFLRMEHSIHEKTGLYKTRITIDELATKSHDELKAIAKNIRYLPEPKSEFIAQANKTFLEFQKKAHDFLNQKDYSRYNEQLEFDPPCIVHLLNNSTGQGTRNQVCSILCAHFRARGYDFDTALKMLEDWNRDYCSPRMASMALKASLRSMWNSNKRYGCSSLKDSGGCSDKCQWYLRRKRHG